MEQKNIYGRSLQICSTNPMTGWYRDGYAKTDENDRGSHTVCATMTAEVSTESIFRHFTEHQGFQAEINRQLTEFFRFVYFSFWLILKAKGMTCQPLICLIFPDWCPETVGRCVRPAGLKLTPPDLRLWSS